MKKKLLSSILLVCILVSSCSLAPNTTISNTETSTETSLETLTETFPIETNVSTTESKLTETNEITKIPSNIFFENTNQLFFPTLYPLQADYHYYIDNISYVRGLVSLDNVFCTNSTEFKYEKIETDVPTNIVWNFQGVDYNLVYKCSKYFLSGHIMTDVYVDEYVFADYPSDANGCVMFEHNTDIVRYILLDGADIKSFQSLNYTTKDEYIQFLSNVLGNTVNLSNYEMNCITSYIDANGKIKKIDGFYIIQEDEVLKNYDFTFTLKRHGYFTNNKITFEWHPNNRIGDWFRIYNFSGNYQFNEAMNITEEEINYAIRIIDEWINKPIIDDLTQDPDTNKRLKRPIEQLSDVEFVQIARLFDKTYLVYKIEYYVFWPTDFCFYVDYERLQQKMALEGIKP